MSHLVAGSIYIICMYLLMFYFFFAVIQLFIVHPPPIRDLVYSSTWYQVWKCECVIVRTLCTWYLGACIHAYILGGDMFFSFCTCCLQFTLEIFWVHPPPRELAYNSSSYCTDEWPRTRYCNYTGIMKEKKGKRVGSKGQQKARKSYSRRPW